MNFFKQLVSCDRNSSIKGKNPNINEKMYEEIKFIRRRLGWIIFWLFIIALGVGALIP